MSRALRPVSACRTEEDRSSTGALNTKHYEMVSQLL